jgi:glycosyltransferase involved in cell wall biosynthesis
LYTESDHTFVVCAYGESQFLGECLDSLKSQTVKTNVIISTSTPNASIAAAAEKYGVQLFVNEGKPGIAHDWNCAIEHCDAPLVTIAHQDDTYEPDYSKKMLEGINAVSDPIIFFSGYGELRESGKVTSNRLLNVKKTLLRPLENPKRAGSKFVRRRCLSLGSPICCPAVTYVLPALEKPLFVEGFKSDLDWEAWEKFSRLDGSFVYDPEVLMWHRIHEGSETSALIKDDTRTKEDLVMLSKFWPTPIAKVVNHFYSKGQDSNAQ